MKLQQYIFPIVTGVIIFGIVFFLLHSLNSHTDKFVSPISSKTTVKLTPTPSPTPSPLTNIKLPIVMFHYVEYVQNPNDTLRMKMASSPLILDFQMKALKDNKYQTYFVKDIPEILVRGQPLNDKSIILTFDDGYADFYQNVFPLLKKYQLKATIFIIVNYIGRSGFMTQSQIQELVDSGLVELGAHTMNHPSLSRITPEKARTEIFDSKKRLEELFHVPVKTFAYPGGAYNNTVLDLVKETSYEAAVTTNPGTTLQYDHLYELPRIRPGFLTIPLIKNYFENLIFRTASSSAR